MLQNDLLFTITQLIHSQIFIKMCLLLYLTTLSLLSLPSSVTGKEFENFYQDLTELINNCLVEGSIYELQIEEALKKSTLVYYSTDLLLNNISQLTPVFNLLNKACPRNSRFSLMLSLRYTYQNRFLWQRIDDIFYNLSLDITPEIKPLLRRHLTSIVLDWTVNVCEHSTSFFSRAVKYHGYGFDSAPIIAAESGIQNISYSVPKYVKNFLLLYCGKSVACSKITVGVSYHPVQIGCANYLLNQIRDSDFVLLPVTFSSQSEFPFSYQKFRVYMNSLENQNDNFIGRKLGKRIIYQLQIYDLPAVNQIQLEWKQVWNDLEILMSSSKFYNEVVHQLIFSTHEKSVELLEKFMIKFAHYDNLKENDTLRIVLGRGMIRKFKLQDKSENVRYKLLIPHLYTDEVEATPCSLKLGLTRTGSGNIIVSANTWRAVARFRQQILNPNLNCSDYHNDASHIENFSDDRNVTLIFDESVIALWNDVERYMTQLIEETRDIDSTILRTIIFPEFSISDSTKKFINKISKTYSIGCVVKFNKEKLEILKLKTIFSTNIKFSHVMKELCPNIFEQVETFIWNIDDLGTEVEREMIVLARQIFMREFPGKSVLIQVTGSGQFNFGSFVSDWAEFYNIPVAL